MTSECMENGITFDSSFKIILSACSEYILVDHNGENLIQYECLNSNFFNGAQRETIVYGASEAYHSI